MASQTSFFSTNTINIIKSDTLENTYIFKFNLSDDEGNKNNNELLIQSIISLGIPLIKSEDESDEDTYTYTLTSKLLTLDEFHTNRKKLLSYQQTLAFTIMIGNQIEELKTHNLCFPFINLEKIIVIDEQYFINLDDELLNINENDTILIKKPYKKISILGHELYNIKKLPSYIPYNNWMSSLGLCAVYLLTNNLKIENKTSKEYSKIIENIQSTKLYFMILRLLERKNTKRLFLYV